MTKIFVGNLDFQASVAGVRGLFEPFGDIDSVDIAADWETGHSRGFAFVTMKNDSEAGKAIAGLSDASLDGRSLTIRTAPVVPAVGFRSPALGT